MQAAHKISLRVHCARLLVVLLLTTICSIAQDKPETFQATAFGQGTQMGRTFGVNITIESYSPPEDQQVLLAAFDKGGNEGLVDALDKMPSRGRISITGTLGYDVTYIRVFPTATGRKIRLVTNRPITFGEAVTNSRSAEYTLSALELDLSNEKGKSAGTLIPACQFKVTPQKELEIEALQNPWRLTNVIDWGSK